MSYLLQTKPLMSLCILRDTLKRGIDTHFDYIDLEIGSVILANELSGESAEVYPLGRFTNTRTKEQGIATASRIIIPSKYFSEYRLSQIRNMGICPHWELTLTDTEKDMLHTNISPEDAVKSRTLGLELKTIPEIQRILFIHQLTGKNQPELIEI